jgi:iron complex outermembrane recepter protein
MAYRWDTFLITLMGEVMRLRRSFTPCVVIVALLASMNTRADDSESQADLSRLSLEELANVQVTSVSKSPEPLQRAAANVYVITHEQILRSGATSLVEALRLAPNLQATQLTASSYQLGKLCTGEFT